MVGYERAIPKRLSRSRERTGRGPPLCETRDCIKDITTRAQEKQNGFWLKQLLDLGVVVHVYTHEPSTAHGHVQTNTRHYYQQQLLHNTTGRKETAADVNAVCRGGGGGWVVDSAGVGWWIRERPDKGAHCSASLKHFFFLKTLCVWLPF